MLICRSAPLSVFTTLGGLVEKCFAWLGKRGVRLPGEGPEGDFHPVLTPGKGRPATSTPTGRQVHAVWLAPPRGPVLRLSRLVLATIAVFPDYQQDSHDGPHGYPEPPGILHITAPTSREAGLL